MIEDLLKQKVTGEVLRAYDKIIRDWVLSKLSEVTLSGGVTEEQVNTIVNNALKNFGGGLTEEQTRYIVDTAIANSGHLTEEQVQNLIDTSIGAAIADQY